MSSPLSVPWTRALCSFSPVIRWTTLVSSGSVTEVTWATWATWATRSAKITVMTGRLDGARGPLPAVPHVVRDEPGPTVARAAFAGPTARAGQVLLRARR
ncbi:hypothetical protein [Streptomyces sp. NPDC048643]|uniref:hypothetical protein n=1 Tax=Streptomyces sp. NPDC048643 TaxID=3155637 RepID=UPI003429D45D